MTNLQTGLKNALGAPLEAAPRVFSKKCLKMNHIWVLLAQGHLRWQASKSGSGQEKPTGNQWDPGKTQVKSEPKVF